MKLSKHKVVKDWYNIFKEKLKIGELIKKQSYVFKPSNELLTESDLLEITELMKELNKK